MFELASRENAGVAPLIYLNGPAGLELGSAATFASNALAKTAPTAKPTHIIAGLRNAQGKYPVVRVLPTMIWKVPATNTVELAQTGNLVTISADALGVTSTTTGGVFTVVATDAINGNCTVRGYFA